MTAKIFLRCLIIFIITFFNIQIRIVVQYQITLRNVVGKEKTVASRISRGYVDAIETRTI